MVIPAYNAEATIGDTLRSVRSQTHRDLEIIVVDDGSADRTSSVVASHAAVDRRIVLLSQQNAGVAAARNAGWQAAHSSLVAFVDADDLWAPTKTEKQLARMIAGGDQVGLVYTWFDVIDQRSRIRYRVPGRRLEGNVYQQLLLGNFIGHASSPLIRRQALVEAGGFDPELRGAGAQGCEDLKLYQQIALRYQFALVPEHLTGYRVVPQRMSNDLLRMLRSFRMVAEEARQSHPEFSRQVDAGIRRYVQFLLGEAAAAHDPRQAWALLAAWVPRHPADAVLIPLAALWSEAGRRLRLLAHASGGGASWKANQPFPIGDVAPHG